MYLHLRVDVHSETHKQMAIRTWLAVESRTSVSSYLGLVSWMYLHLGELMFTLGLEPSTVHSATES
ncbi:unnamed protein product [Schistosoma curassoni]|uniref:Ovule protein n=1 Tax=Schistosoma curassoni TaxID=6186 RepID=A0A183KJ33_9TREM|nr:unnamed protein product [Schistosoma curassoni]